MNSITVTNCEFINLNKHIRCRNKGKLLINSLLYCTMHYNKIITNTNNNNTNNTNNNNTNIINTNNTNNIDNYPIELLEKRLIMFQQYESTVSLLRKEYNHKIRSICFPEDISENLIKYIIRLKGIKCINNKIGDLYSEDLGKLECKAFSSDGPISFGPTESWDKLLILDAKDYLKCNFTLYKVDLKNTDKIWKELKINRIENYEKQIKNKRRPRIKFDDLHNQLKEHITILFKGTFDEIMKKI